MNEMVNEIVKVGLMFFGAALVGFVLAVLVYGSDLSTTPVIKRPMPHVITLTQDVARLQEQVEQLQLEVDMIKKRRVGH